MEEWRRSTGVELLRDIQKIPKRNERGGIQRKSRVNGVVESENKQRLSCTLAAVMASHPLRLNFSVVNYFRFI